MKIETEKKCKNCLNFEKDLRKRLKIICFLLLSLCALINTKTVHYMTLEDGFIHTIKYIIKLSI